MREYCILNPCYSAVVSNSSLLSRKRRPDSLARDEQVQTVRCGDHHIRCRHLASIGLSYHRTLPRMAWLPHHQGTMVLRLRYRADDHLYWDLGNWTPRNHSRKGSGQVEASSKRSQDRKLDFHRQPKVGGLNFKYVLL